MPVEWWYIRAGPPPHQSWPYNTPRYGHGNSILHKICEIEIPFWTTKTTLVIYQWLIVNDVWRKWPRRLNFALFDGDGHLWTHVRGHESQSHIPILTRSLTCPPMPFAGHCRRISPDIFVPWVGSPYCTGYGSLPHPPFAGSHESCVDDVPFLPVPRIEWLSIPPG